MIGTRFPLRLSAATTAALRPAWFALAHRSPFVTVPGEFAPKRLEGDRVGILLGAGLDGAEVLAYLAARGLAAEIALEWLTARGPYPVPLATADGPPRG